MKKSTALAGVTLAATIAAAVYLVTKPSDAPPVGISNSGAAEAADLVIPALSAQAAEGERYFDAVCASCHGDNGSGTDQGPPLIHDIYNPGHHADEAFFSAAKSGVPQHHWPFGNMPPQKVTRAEVARIVAYIRELQAANGITYRPHNM